METNALPSLRSLSSGPLFRLRRSASLACQRVFWSAKPLSHTAAQQIVRKVDPAATLGPRLRSQTHQVFPATFRGRPAIAKFSGPDFECKFILRGEVARLRRLSASGAPVPELLFAAEDRIRYPFFVTRDLGILPRAKWTEDVHRQCWEFQAGLIHGFGDAVTAAALPVMSLDASRQSMRQIVQQTESGLRKFGIERAEFLAAIEVMRADMDRHPWIMGAIQPPEPVFDGKRFWAVDWEPARYVPPLKWVCDYTYFIQVREPALAARYVAHLSDALNLRLSKTEFRATLERWYRFKALEIGIYLLNKGRGWEYFRSLQQTFFGRVLADETTPNRALFRRAFAV